MTEDYKPGAGTHPITPPPELVQAWINRPACKDYFSTVEEVAITSARWGADQELEACCEWLGREVGSGWGLGAQLRTNRRPKPPSLKEQALAALAAADGADHPVVATVITADQHAIIRRALKQLDD